ncbi:MAG TPA: class I SAM-dependent methyltransferase [Acidimicrobiales bacterium]|nr:class I SAM-dependent methyltransferase [Acidimicrobiales bacterium]
MKPEDVVRYSREQWSEPRAEALDAEIAGYPFSVREAQVLDLAAGPGAYTAALLRAGAGLVVWHDVDAGFLESAKRALPSSPRVRFEVRDMLDLPYPAGSFDMVALRDALHWASDEARLLRHLAALIRPGGWLVLTNHNFRRPLATVRPRWRAAAHLASPPLAALLGRKPVPTLWVLEGLTRRRLRCAGFEVVEWRRPRPADFEAICRRSPGPG